MKKADKSIDEAKIRSVSRQLDDIIREIEKSSSVSNEDISRINALRVQLNTRRNWLRYRMSENPQEVLEYQYEFAR